MLSGSSASSGEQPLPPGHPPAAWRAREAATLSRGGAQSDVAKSDGTNARALDLRAVQSDLRKLFVASNSEWPADFGNYGPLFIRLAWHCSGSYRTSDGRGGCRGGRQRFDPERSWEDNTNLDKARSLLWPVKLKHGAALSWGDLFVLAGTTAIEAMGGPTIGFCAGRVDDDDGFWSQPLGPSPQQEALAPCADNGDCKTPLGSTTVGLIYLNPEGPMGKPDPAATAATVRDAFGRMGMNDSETVALIGGGHAFGKAHGACPKGAGPPPRVDPLNPWPGECGTGRGADTFTSGFEGSWTTDPTRWDNSYFHNLLDNEWEVWVGPGGHHQWRVKGAARSNSTRALGGGGGGGNVSAAAVNRDGLMMLTSDVSLLHDAEYADIVRRFAKEPASFDAAFAQAWYKLTTRDMGPPTRCVGDLLPPPQPWQHALPPPPPPGDLPDFDKVATELRRVVVTPSPALPPDRYDGKPWYGALFVRLAWRCASTFRVTDFRGGCNGARVRHRPEADWALNADLDRALAVLEPVKSRFGAALSWADLIVLAGNVGLESAGVPPLPFCGGRVDAASGAGSEGLEPRVTGDASLDAPAVASDVLLLTGLTLRQRVALLGGGHSIGAMHVGRTGFEGSWTSTPTEVNNEYFKNVLGEVWRLHRPDGTGGPTQFKASGKDLFALSVDVRLRTDPELAAAAALFAENEAVFLEDFAAAWTRVMNGDRFDGPTGNVCDR